MQQSLVSASPTDSSVDTSHYVVNPETLDKVFTQKLVILRHLMHRLRCRQEINLCRKWLKVFIRTSQEEKVARNCLVALMQSQLQEADALDEPFTNADNCNRDLNCLLGELESNYATHSALHSDMTAVETSRSRASAFAPDDELCLRLDDKAGGHCTQHQTPSNKQLAESQRLPFCLEMRLNEMSRENMRLRNDLERMRLQLTEKQMENAKLSEIANKHEAENVRLAELFENLQLTLLEGVQDTLKQLKTAAAGPDEQQGECSFGLFVKIFNEIKSDSGFRGELRKCDAEFEKLVNTIFEKAFDRRKAIIAKHMAKKMRKAQKKMRERYNERIRVHNWAQTMQLKLVQLKCFSDLRQLVMMQNNFDGKTNVLQILETLEEHYQCVIEDEAN